MLRIYLKIIGLLCLLIFLFTVCPQLISMPDYLLFTVGIFLVLLVLPLIYLASKALYKDIKVLTEKKGNKK